jgi:peptidoglycan-associated lipoprotein
MHKMRVVAMINVALVGLMVFTNTGCKSKNKTGALDGAGPTLIEGDAMLDGLSDINGMVGGGTSFRDMYKPVTDLAFEPVYFTLDSYSLPPNEIAKITLVGQHLNATPNHVLIVEGNCDERGSDEYNLSLGENRALAVRSFLVNMGVSADRIQTISFGEEKPAVVGNDESAWSLNRRGEFALFQK